jgi:hypothetical protein
MKLVIETSVLISASIYCKYPYQGKCYVILEPTFWECDRVFTLIQQKGKTEEVIITKTVEDEARKTLKKAVGNTINAHSVFSGVDVISWAKLQRIIHNASLIRLERYIEECSIRLPIDIKLRDSLKCNTITPFVKRITATTVRYLKPSIPFLVKNRSDRMEIARNIVNGMTGSYNIYPGMPGSRDLTIMAEAHMIALRFQLKEMIYVVSNDKHFIPNPVIIESYLSPYHQSTGKLDSTVRDAICKQFGFVGEHPREIIKLI